MKKEKYDIFISYRRSDGFSTARLIYDRLNMLGYRVSFDMETLRSGNFNTQLYERIENCRDFIVILSNDALAFRDNPKSDWLRLEVSHALKCKKNIIPVFLRDVVIPEKMPDDVSDLVMKNGVTASDEHFDSTLNKICKLLYSRKRINKKYVFSIVILLILLFAVFGYLWYNSKNTQKTEGDDKPKTKQIVAPEKNYPYTDQEKQEFGLIFNYLIFQMNNVNLANYYYNRLLKEAENAILTGELEKYKNEKLAFKNNCQQLKNVKFDSSLIKMAINSKVIDANNLQTFPMLYDNYTAFLNRTPEILDNCVNPDTIISKTDRLSLIKIKKDFGDILVRNLELNCIALILNVKSPLIDDFKKHTAPQLTNLSVLNGTWPTEKDEIVRLMTHDSEKLKILLKDEAEILGTVKQGVVLQEQELRHKLKQSGASGEQIERILQKQKELERKKRQLQTNKKQLDDLTEKARKKFAPQPSDSDGILWSKMVALEKCYLHEDALKALEVMGKNKDPFLSEKVLFIAEIILRRSQPIPFSNGVIIVSFEPGYTKHAIFQVGDIITKYNDKDCYTNEDYRSEKGAKYTVFRLNKTGKFERLSLVMPEKQPKVLSGALPLI